MMEKKIFHGFCKVLLSIPLLLLSCNKPYTQEPPYPPSKIISGIKIDWTTHERRALGSDNWAITWADDGHQYATWGDGGGFGGTNSLGRVPLGIARIEGSRDSYRGVNVYGGYNAENRAEISGKSRGIISIDGTLYIWITPGSNVKGYNRATLYSSKDHGASWHSADWHFAKADGLIFPTFLQFGMDYANAVDKYAYTYAVNLKDDRQLTIQKPGQIILVRVPKNALMDRKQYEFFAGLKSNGRPRWVSELSKSQPVFTDNLNGVGWSVSVSYNNGLNRYILVTEHTASFKSNIGIYDSPTPWGPWTTVYFGSFGLGNVGRTCFFYNFSNKWQSKDGSNFTLIFTGIKSNDSWNSVQGSFLFKK